MTCCPTLDQLPPVALETTLISFRIGLLAANTRDQIEVGKTKLASWRAKIEINNTESVVHQLEEFSNQKVKSSRLSNCQPLTIIASIDMVEAVRVWRLP